MKSKTETRSPKREKLLTLTLDDIVTKERIDNCDPKLPARTSDMCEPSRMKLRREQLDPRRKKSNTEFALVVSLPKIEKEELIRR
jgi:hypothetical protein